MRENRNEKRGATGLILMLVLAVAVVILSNPLYLWLTGAGRGVTYTSVQKGYGGDVTVTLVEESGTLLQLKAEGPGETPGIGASALGEFNKTFESMKGIPVSEVNPEVDSVSGATLTSRAVKKGLQDVLEQVNGDCQEGEL